MSLITTTSAFAKETRPKQRQSRWQHQRGQRYQPVVHLGVQGFEQGDEDKGCGHSDFIYNKVNRHGTDYDMMLECKMKELDF